MKTFIQQISTIAIIVTLTSAMSSCSSFETEEFQKEETTNESVWVRVQLDWSNLSQAPKYSTIAFFSQEGDAPVYMIMSEIRDSIRLRAGRYSVVAFNGTLNGQENILFENINDFESLSAKTSAMENIPSCYNMEDGMIGMNQPNALYVDRRENFDVTEEMVAFDVRPMLHFEPTCESKTITLEVNIEGIDQLSNEGNIAVVSGMPSGLYMSSGDVVTDSPVKYYSKMESMSIENGTMKFNYTTFGNMPASVSENMTITLFLRNTLGEDLSPIEVSVSNIASRFLSSNMSISVEI